MVTMLLTAGRKLRDLIVANPVAGLVGSLLAALGVMWLRVRHLQGEARRQKAKAWRASVKAIRLRAGKRDVDTMSKIALLESDMKVAEVLSHRAEIEAEAILAERKRIADMYRRDGPS